jgi:hypothetical protein
MSDIKPLFSQAAIVSVDECLALLLAVENDTFVPNLFGWFTHAANLFTSGLALFGAAFLIESPGAVRHTRESAIE